MPKKNQGVEMSEDLQSLLEKINRDGVEKAEAEATRIIEDAKAKAAAILKEAIQRYRFPTKISRKSADRR
jgi:F0F1-type ATP synthase membrane subunit b/b'